MNEKILVVVPTLNEAPYIRTIVSALSSQLAGFPGSRIVIADGGSIDGTHEIACALAQEIPAVTVLRNPKKIQSAAVNLAVNTYGAEADVLVRCDAHGAYPGDFISSLIASLNETGADTVVVSLRSSGTSCIQKAVAWISDTPLGSGGAAHRAGQKSGFVDHGHHAAFRMASFVGVGGYNESFAYNEDAELDCRFREERKKIYLNSAINIIYYPRSTFRSLSRQYMRYGSGRAGTFLRHPSSLKARQVVVPANFLCCAVAIATSFVLPVTLVWPLFYLSVLLGCSVVLAVKRRSWCGLLTGAAGFVMHQSWAYGFLCGFVAGVLTPRRSTRPA